MKTDTKNRKQEKLRTTVVGGNSTPLSRRRLS